MDTHSSLNFEITDAKTHEDVILTARMARRIWEEYYTPLLGPAQVAYMLEHLQSEDAIENAIENGTRYCLVWYKGREAGYFATKTDENKLQLFLSKLYIKNSARGKGLTRYVFDTLVSECKQNQIEKIWLTVNKQNSQAIAVYEKLGFCITQSIINQIGEGFVMDDFLMEYSVS